jgi:hypothetical protein
MKFRLTGIKVEPANKASTLNQTELHPVFFGTLGQTRTDNTEILSLLPLPVGLQGQYSLVPLLGFEPRTYSF